MMRNPKNVAAILLLLVCTANAAPAALPTPNVPDGASGESAYVEDGPQVFARLVVESEGVLTDESFRVGILFDIEPGWHIYWRNPGDSALPTRIQWSLDDATVGELKWPAPKVFHEPETGFTTFGYDEQALLGTEMAIRTQGDGPVTLGASVNFLACKDICIPGNFDLERTLVLGATPERDAKIVSLFDHYEAMIPQPIEVSGNKLETRLSQSAVRPGDSFLLGIGAGPCENESDCDRAPLRSRDPASIFIPYSPINPSLKPLGVQAYPGRTDGFLFALRGHVEGDAPPRTEEPLRGVFLLPDSGYVEVSLPFPTAEVNDPVELFETDWLDPDLLKRPQFVSIDRGYALLLALIGGILLNLMPCVLPVLAIKIVSLAELAHQPRKHVAAHGASYLLGIQASMALLTGAVLALRQAGVAVGWGFQFQEPVFIVAVAILVVLFACNLFGMFEINLNTSSFDGVGREATGLRRSFFDGFLAVALATPCSAPFLGTAVGFAFAGAALDIVLIFAGIGLGLALPFVAVSLAPGLSRFIPAAGPWMIRLRAVLGLALLATATWLLFILEGTAGTAAQLSVLVMLAFVALGAYFVGRVQRQHPEGGAGLASAGLAALTLATVVLLPLEPIQAELADSSESAIPWMNFDPAAIQNELAADRAVFVYFTANWCITCKVNEKLVLENEAVTDALEQLDIATFRGDWTLRDEEIRKELARHGKAGVPVYLVYAPDRPNTPRVLPELITVDSVLKALERAARRRNI